MSEKADIHHESDGNNATNKLDTRGRRDARFWLVFLSLNIALFLSALELTSVPNALPTISKALHADQFVWVGSAYALAATAFPSVEA
ncbi:hypothetical protein EW146_g4960 [Bondarzewia mesenterica]|uniref:Major facilitator superfamily (MFS) profile domain-containing protein n=1 Tax=Bondarzewia mesenterica TaxID=1095465 RepID=A0A4S4LV29_9AGAM|nr:hypothetical protein EW146_g4960 [Bondarzewia mesenterica]